MSADILERFGMKFTSQIEMIEECLSIDLDDLTDDCIEINDVFKKFMDYEAKGLFEIKPLESISEKELNFVHDDIRKNIIEYNLKDCPNNPMSQFILKHFPQIWFE